MRSFDYYIYLAEDSEKYNFLDKKMELSKKISKLTALAEFEDNEIPIEKNLLILNKKLERLLAIDRAGAIKRIEREISPLVAGVKSNFTEGLLKINARIKFLRDRIDAYQRKIKKIFLISLLTAIILFILFSFHIFKSISIPLREFGKAAISVGKGNLDYQIRIKQKDEFLRIADAFNQMAKNLKEFHLKVSQMGRMVAIGELAGGVAHEINNPLTGILGHTQRLLEKVPENSEVYPIMKKVERAAIRCRNIVDSLLNFSKQDELGFRRCNINKILEDTFSLCETDIISKGIRLEKKYSANLPEVRVFPGAIQHVFLNIINNAIHAMPNGGDLVIATNLIMAEGFKYVEVKFEDTGHGFTSEVQERLFDLFFTTKGPDKGTGLGLSLAYRIVKRHGGFIIGESGGVGQGAVFKIKLPVEPIFFNRIEKNACHVPLSRDSALRGPLREKAAHSG